MILFCLCGIIIKKTNASNNGEVIINELLWSGSSLSSADEFIELFNNTDREIDLSGWNISRISNGEEILMLEIPAGKSISAGGYFLIANYSNDYANSILGINPDVVNTAVSLSNDKLQISLYDGAFIDKKNLIDVAGSVGIPLAGENLAVKKSMEREDVFGDGTKKANWHTCYEAKNLDDDVIDCGTPGAKNSIKPADEPKIEYPVGILFNEIYPKPNTNSGEKEYVELLNSSTEKITLDGWKIVDYGKHECLLNGKNIDAEKLLFIEADPENKCVLELNDTGTETVWLRNPSGDDVITLKYSSAKEGQSYNYDGSHWRWSKFLTPGSENIFNNEPYGTIKKDKEVFAKTYAYFSISTSDKDGDKVKVVWDFGDGHKSYLAKTKHKYEKTGKFEASVKLSDGSEDVVKNFTVEVENFPHPKVSIISIKANPVGNDSIGESIIIENKSKKKINLKGWSVATGIKNLVNHPINADLVIEKNKFKELTRKFSSFALNNKASKIELRYPDGKVASKAEYDHGKSSIGEDEIYRKIKGGWEWVLSQKSIKFVKSIKQNSENAINAKVENNILHDIIKKEQATKENVLGVESKYILPEWVLKNNIQIELLKNILQITDIRMLHEFDGQYFFTKQNYEHKHYAVVFLRNTLLSLNVQANLLLNYFFK